MRALLKVAWMPTSSFRSESEWKAAPELCTCRDFFRLAITMILRLQSTIPNVLPLYAHDVLLV